MNFHSYISCTHFYFTTPLCLAHNSLKRGWENSLKLKWVYVVVVVAAAHAVDYNICTPTTTTRQQQHKVLSKRCHLLPFGVVGVCRKGRHLSHSSRKHCLRRIFQHFSCFCCLGNRCRTVGDSLDFDQN